MSYFIANSISISKDLKTFRVKGGDNNCFPRSNYWSNDINIDMLFNEIQGGMIQFNVTTNEKICFIQKLVQHSLTDWRNNYKGLDYYDLKRQDLVSKEITEFDGIFLEKLKNGLKSLSTKKEYVLKVKNGDFIYSKKRRRSTLCRSKNLAQHFSYHVALNTIKAYADLELIKVDW